MKGRRLKLGTSSLNGMFRVSLVCVSQLMQTQKPPPVASSASVIYGDSSGFMRFTVIILSILMRNLEIVFKCLQARVGVTVFFHS